jgi:hypothetical protein
MVIHFDSNPYFQKYVVVFDTVADFKMKRAFIDFFGNEPSGSEEQFREYCNKYIELQEDVQKESKKSAIADIMWAVTDPKYDEFIKTL